MYQLLLTKDQNNGPLQDPQSFPVLFKSRETPDHQPCNRLVQERQADQAFHPLGLQEIQYTGGSRQ